jgi:hypothetical protein
MGSYVSILGSLAVIYRSSVSIFGSDLTGSSCLTLSGIIVFARYSNLRNRHRFMSASKSKTYCVQISDGKGQCV